MSIHMQFPQSTVTDVTTAMQSATGLVHEHGKQHTAGYRDQDASPGTRTLPSINTRALRLMIALATVHRPSAWMASAPTRRVPEGWPKRTALRSPPPAARLTSVPGIAAAVPIATAAVP